MQEARCDSETATGEKRRAHNARLPRLTNRGVIVRLQAFAVARGCSNMFLFHGRADRR